jgi:DNA modification methylase
MKLSINKIKPNPNNPRFIKDEDYKKLVKSIKEFPEMLEAREIVLNKEHIILGGNMRFRAAQEAGIKEVPVKIVDWSLEKQNEFIIKDNVSGGEWDWDILANEWDTDQLDEWGLELPESMQEESEVEEDEPPEVSSEPPVSQLGVVYQLGRHRVMCGDSTKPNDIDNLMDGEQADLVWIDPPYNVDYTGGTGLKIENDKMEDNQFYNFLLDAFTRCEEVMKEGAPIYIAHADSEGKNFRQAMIDSGLLLKQCIIWVKSSMVMGRQDYQWQHEPILYGWKAGEAHKWYGNFDKKTIIDDAKDLKDLKKEELLDIVRQLYQKTTAIREDKPSKNGEHPTMKPIVLVARFIWNSSKPEDIVLDTFLGSGSTLIACEQTDRTCYGMELDPKYVDVIRKRYAKYCYPDTWEERWEELTPVLSEK